MSAFLDGIGSIFSKVTDWIPGRREHIRNKIAELKKEQDELLKKPSSYDNVRRITTIAIELRKLEEKISNT